MMRSIVLAATFGLITSGAGAADDGWPPMDYANIKTLPCSTYVLTRGVPISSLIQDPLAAYVFAHGRPGRAFGSACNVSDRVDDFCEAHTEADVGQAVDYLIDLQRKGKPLPSVRRCELPPPLS